MAVAFAGRNDSLHKLNKNVHKNTLDVYLNIRTTDEGKDWSVIIFTLGGTKLEFDSYHRGYWFDLINIILGNWIKIDDIENFIK